MPRIKSDTIEAMGTERFLNTRFAYLEERFNMKPSAKFQQMITAGQPDSEIAKEFSTEDRRLKYQTVGNWRRYYLEEQEA